MIPFSLMWGGAAIFSELAALISGASPVTTLWGIPFVLVGLYLIFGRFMVDSAQRARTYYGVTNQRIVVASGLLSRNVKSLNLRTLNDLSVHRKSSGEGTISFGTAPASSWWAGSGWPGAGRHLPPRFEMIPDVKTVYEIIRRSQAEA
jgi:hypothetical protein